MNADARFNESDLNDFKSSEITSLSLFSSAAELSPKLMKFLSSCKPPIVASLNKAELAMCNRMVKKKATQELMSLSDVHGHYVNKQETYFSPKSMVVEKQTPSGVEKMVIQGSPWVAPAHLVKDYPGIQFMVGMAITILKREDKMVSVHYDGRPYQELSYTGVDSTCLQGFGQVLVSFIHSYFAERRNTGQGREFINELFCAIGALSKEDYFRLQYELACGPFNHCFSWSDRRVVHASRLEKGKMVKRRAIQLTPLNEYNITCAKYMYLTGVKKLYEKAFVDVSNSPTVAPINEKEKLGTYLPVWIGAIPNAFNVPKAGVDLTPAKAYEFMQMCRLQRQTDEKGLSAWSSGFGACGNPTKLQLRLNKKLSLIMGQILSGQYTRVVLIDEKESDIEPVIAQLTKWSVSNSTFREARNKCPFVFRVARTQYVMIGKFPEYCTSSETFLRGDCVIMFADAPPTIASAKEWAKVDLACQKGVNAMLSPYEEKAKREKEGITFVVSTHVFTRTFFPPRDAKEVREPSFFNYHVFTLGSAHNMMAYLCTSPNLWFAASDGSSAYALAAVKGDEVREHDFFSRVCEHNARRSAFFLTPQFFFNAKLNLLRHIVGKTMNFVTGMVTDNFGVDITDVVQDFSLDGTSTAAGAPSLIFDDDEEELEGIVDGDDLDVDVSEEIEEPPRRVKPLHTMEEIRRMVPSGDVNEYIEATKHLRTATVASTVKPIPDAGQVADDHPPDTHVVTTDRKSVV